MKIASISDMHGFLDFKIDKSDVLFICGDIVPLNIQRNNNKSRKWFVEKFIPWCKEQPVNDIYLVGGNHDWWMYIKPQEVKDFCAEHMPSLHYLLDEEMTYIDDNGNAYKIYGSPWCHQFGNWAFMGYSDEALSDIFMKIPDDVDFLLTHDAPYGVSDVCTSIWNAGEHIGNHGLANVVALKQPKYNFHGHLHSSNHKKELLGETEVYNVSVLDENYKFSYEPLYLEIIK